MSGARFMRVQPVMRALNSRAPRHVPDCQQARLRDRNGLKSEIVTRMLPA